jgi:hypothetical protein
MKKLVNVVGILCFVLFMIASKPVWAAHPLITDDTGTQGKGKFQIELNGEYENDDTEGEKSDVTTLSGPFSAGLTETVDLVLGIPFQHGRVVEDTDDGHETTTDEGFPDVSV